MRPKASGRSHPAVNAAAPPELRPPIARSCGSLLTEYPARASGKSKWRPWQLWNFALEGLFSFTTLPLRIWTYFGVAVACAALAYMVFIILRTLVLGVDVPGYASLIVFLLFFSGMNMIGLGIMGEYLGRIFIEVKGRPLYLVRQAIGFEEASPEELPRGAVSPRSSRASAPGPR